VKTSRKYQHGALALAMVTVFIIIVTGCAEKITGTGESNLVAVNLTLKAGPSVSFRLTVSGADMETIEALMGPSDTELITVVQVPPGLDRLFVVEASDLEGVVMYRGEELHDVTTLLTLDLTIDMPPVVPMLYLNPHYSTVEAGNSFVLTVCVNELVGLTGGGFGISLEGDGSNSKLFDAAVIDTVILDAGLIELGISLNFSRDSVASGFISFNSEGTVLVDENGDGCLLKIHCSSQDLWLDGPVSVIPSMEFENLNGIGIPLGDVHLDSARIRVFRVDSPESYLGTEDLDFGVSMVELNAGEIMMAGSTLIADFEAEVFEYFLSVRRLDQNLQPVFEELLPWSGEQTTVGLARGTSGFFGLGTDSQFGGEVIYFDDIGGEIWRSGLGAIRELYDIASRPGGGCIISGSYSNDGDHLYLAALAEDGTFVPYEPTNFSANEEYRAVVVFEDGTVAAAGTVKPFSANLKNIIVGKYTFNNEFIPIWERELVTNNDRIAHDLLATPDGGLLVVGRTSPTSNVPSDVLAVKLDTDGNIEWERTFAAQGTDLGLAVTMSDGGSYVIAGWTLFPRSTTRDVLVIKISAAGDLIWQRIHGGAEDDLAMDIVPAGNGFVLTGLTSPGPLGSVDVLMLRLDSEGR